MTENEKNDHLTAKYLELAENNVNKLNENSAKKATSSLASNKPVNSNNKNIPERESEEKSEADDESELKIIFSKVIEENLSELFAPYKSEHLGLDLAQEKKKAIFVEEEKTKPIKANKEAARNDKMRAAAPLGFSSSHKLQHGESDDSSSTKTVTQDKNTFEDQRNDFNKSSSSNENEPGDDDDDDDDDDEGQDNLDISIESDENEYRAIESNAFKKATRVESQHQKSDFMDTLDIQKNTNVNNGYENEFEGNFKN
jgi:hypothetical protein